jgi:hypothetical protein
LEKQTKGKGLGTWLKCQSAVQDSEFNPQYGGWGSRDRKRKRETGRVRGEKKGRKVKQFRISKVLAAIFEG